MKTGTRGLLMVQIEVDPEHEEEFNRWYEEEHLPERLACNGFLSARRFVAMEGNPKYMAFYELESPAVLDGDDYRRIYEPSEWTKDIHRHFKCLVRNVYVEILREEPIPAGSRSRFRKDRKTRRGAASAAAPKGR